MNLDNVFKKTSKKYLTINNNKPEVPEGLLCKCNKCKAAIIAEDVINDYYICPKCKAYFRVEAYDRVNRVADEGSFEEWNEELVGNNPMDY